MNILPHRLFSRTSEQGFTLIEIVFVLILLAVLAATSSGLVSMPLHVSPCEVEKAKITSFIAHARQEALLRRQGTALRFTASTANNPATIAWVGMTPPPGEGGLYTLGEGMTVSGAEELSFDKTGATSQVTITLTDGDGRTSTLAISPQGYVR